MRSVLTLIIVLIASPLVGQSWSTLNKKGLSMYRKGEYSKAAEYLSKAVARSSRAHGHRSTEHLTTLTNLAYVRQAQGEYGKAQEVFREAFRISSTLHNIIHIDHIEATINLANLFLLSGDYDSAEFYFEGARRNIFTAVQERTSHYIEKVNLFLDALINVQAGLASLYFKKGQVDKAIATLAQQRAFIRETYPDDYRSSAVYKSTINNLATYYLSREDLTNAEPIIKEQVLITGDSWKREPIRYLQALNNLGNIYRHSNKPDSARTTWRSALDIVNNGVAIGSDIHVTILTNLGELELARDSTEQAINYLTSATVIQEKRGAINPRIYQGTLLNLAEAFWWDGRMQQADQTYSKLTELVIDEVLHHFTYLSDSEKISFYRDNSYILEHFSWFAFEVSGSLIKPLQDRYTNADALKRLFDLRLITKGLILHPGYRLKNLISSGNTQISNTYKKWEDVKYAYATLRRADSVDVSRLSSLSHQAETLEKWLRANSPEFRRGFVVEKTTWNDVQQKLGPGEAAVELIRLGNGLVYGALILTQSTTNGPVAAFVKGTEKLHLEKQFYSQYANAITHGFTDTISYRRYWEPIMKTIRKNMPASSSVKTIYLSADGIYHNININTLLNSSDNAYVLDETDVRHVTNLKDISESKNTADTSLLSGFFVGRPQFSITDPDRNLFSDLPGTELEVSAIEKMLSEKNWSTTLLLHAKAQESAVKKIKAPTILHVATHGFFIDQSGVNDFTDVLLNSGIALAGAEDGKADEGEDGILTAYEMMNIDLEGTKLVVLSACETGLGTFYSGEGVYGLQRAIRSAGANAVIMSLWKVDDLATQQLMTAFYRLWLVKPDDPRGAFRSAQQELKAHASEPRYWGAFVYME